MWRFWLENPARPSKELKEVVRAAISVDHEMKEPANNYFKLEEKLEEKQFMARSHAIALIGCAPLIRTSLRSSTSASTGSEPFQRPRCNF